MKAWQIVAALVGLGVIMVLIRNMQASKAQISTGATSNDVIVGLSKFGSGLLSLGGKIFTPGASDSSDGGIDYGVGTSFAQGGTSPDNPTGTGNNIFDIGTG